MEAGGFYSLGDIAVTAAAIYLGTPIDELDGMTAVTAQVKFAYGSGGTSGNAFLQTSLDQSATWIDIASVTFTTAGKTVVLNFSGLTPRLTEYTPTDGSLANDTAVDGILGDRLRLKVVTVGTYAGSTLLSGRIAVR